MDVKYQVFISSTYNDLKKERKEIIEALINLAHFPVGMELFNAADDTQWDVIKRRISESDYYVLILSDRYGSTDEDGLAFTEKEYDYAIFQGKPVISFVRSQEEIDKLPFEFRESENREKLDAFKEKVSGRLYKSWQDKHDLSKKFFTSFAELTSIKPQKGWVRGDSITLQHSELALKYAEISNKYQIIKDENEGLKKQCENLKNEALIAPKIFKNFEHTLPAVENVLNKLISDTSVPVLQTDALKIRVLGVCFHKSFPFIKDYIEVNCKSGKRIEIRLSKLDRTYSKINVLDKIWNGYYDVYEEQQKEFIKKITSIDGANVSLKISKYSHMPNWHGIMINNSHLFLSACVWNNEGMTAGENHYVYYKSGADAHWMHKLKIAQFTRWFDYGRYKGTVERKDQLIFDTNNS